MLRYPTWLTLEFLSIISFSVCQSSHLPNGLFLSVYFVILNFTLFCIQGVPEAASSNQVLPNMRKQILKSGLKLWRWSYCRLSQISGSNLDQVFGLCPFLFYRVGAILNVLSFSLYFPLPPSRPFTVHNLSFPKQAPGTLSPVIRETLQT